MKEQVTLGPLEQKIMECLWVSKKKKVRDVYECLVKEREIAYTTVMTVMNRLVEKGFLSKKQEGKAYLYSTTQTKKEAAKNAARKTLDLLVNQFGETAITAFVDEIEDLSKQERQELAAKLKKGLGP